MTSADGVLAASVSDDYFAVGNSRSAGDAVILVLTYCLDFPNDLAGVSIKGDEARVESADVNFAVGKRNATVRRTAANAWAGPNLIGFTDRARRENS